MNDIYNNIRKGKSYERLMIMSKYKFEDKKLMDDKILKILAEALGQEENSIKELAENDDLTLIGLDSLNAIEIIVEIENEIGIQVDDEDLLLENLNSKKKLSDLLCKYITN